MALISYIGVLCLVPVLMKNKDEFVKFHAKQGLVLLSGEIIILFASTITPFLMPIWGLINLCWLVLSIVGIMNVVKNEKKQIPFLGKLADKFKI